MRAWRGSEDYARRQDRQDGHEMRRLGYSEGDIRLELRRRESAREELAEREACAAEAALRRVQVTA